MIQPSQIADATELLRQINSGERSSKDIVREHLDRIERLNPTLNAATEIFRSSALAEAESPAPGPLSGLPISLKETFAIEGCEVTMGSRRMRPIQCRQDSEVVKKLKAAGAIIIARTNVPEFVMTGETSNLVFGRTNHPVDPTRSCGGSSGGEGSLVGSACSALGFGTDILGSIRIPSALCGIVGFRPHSGAVDKTGVWPVSGNFLETWNGVGPMARSVRDVRLAYNVIAHKPLLADNNVAGTRLLVPEGFGLKYKQPCIKQAYLDAQQKLKAAGLNVERPVFDDVANLFISIPQLVTGEMVDLWKQWLSSNGNKFRPSVELIRQLLRRPSIDPGFFMWFVTSAVMRPRRSNKLAKIIQRYEAARTQYYDLLGEDGILILPTLGLLAPKHGVMNRISLRPGVNGLFTAETFVNYINLSAITIPAHGHADPATGLKPGIMLVCAPAAEVRLLNVAARLEAVL